MALPHWLSTYHAADVLAVLTLFEQRRDYGFQGVQAEIAEALLRKGYVAGLKHDRKVLQIGIAFICANMRLAVDGKKLQDQLAAEVSDAE
ncbi:MAG TPA: hypothetical protein VNA88_17555 [Candidatus Kapabacteria bacterium]|jgi:hypothetical protein|nr:hypothetical protein [Candidatus Kapabacteria bacterium]